MAVLTDRFPFVDGEPAEPAVEVVRVRKPRKKPVRTIKLALAPFSGNPGIVIITVGKEVGNYYLAPIPADIGAGFRLEKIGSEEIYHVNLNGQQSSCECKGHLRHGHCKHVDGLAALVKAGKLPPDTAPVVATTA